MHLSETDRNTLESAAEKAMEATAAHISIVIAAVSDNYYDFVLLYGFILGSLFGLLSWISGLIVNFTVLLMFQAGAIVIVDALPWCRSWCVDLVPRYARFQRGAREAMRQYQYLRSKQPEEKPFVVIYISTADRYVQIVTNPVVHKEMPENWDAVANDCAGDINRHGVFFGGITTVKRIGEILAKKFPKN